MIYLYAWKKQKIQLKNMAGNSAGNIKELWDNLNHSNILLNGVPKREERENKYIKKKKITAKRKTGQRGLLITSYKRLEKRLWWGHNSCRGDSPCPSHLESPESPQAKQLRHLHAQPSLGQSCHRQKNVSCLCVQGCFDHAQLFETV